MTFVFSQKLKPSPHLVPPSSGFWPLLLVFGPHAAKSWPRAWLKVRASVEKRSWREPTTYRTEPTSQHSEDVGYWETKANLDVDGHTKTCNRQKTPQKTQKSQQHTENQKNSKYRNKICGVPVFAISLLGGGSHPCPLSVTPLAWLTDKQQRWTYIWI